MKPRLCALLAFALAAGCAPLPPAEEEALLKEAGIPEHVVIRPKTDAGAVAEKDRTDPRIINALLAVFERSEKIPRPDPRTLEGQPLDEILRVGSPIGYQLRTRYFNPGVPIADALAQSDDNALRQKLIEFARWEGSEVRSMALVGLAGFHDKDDFKIFQEAVATIDPAIRFGAMEALLTWAQGEAVPADLREQAAAMFRVASDNDREPILRVYAAHAAVRLGHRDSLAKLRGSLDSPGWLERAFAARFLGDVGEAADYDLLLRYIDREVTSEFALAEYCIAALKLFPKKEPAP